MRPVRRNAESELVARGSAREAAIRPRVRLARRAAAIVLARRAAAIVLARRAAAIVLVLAAHAARAEDKAPATSPNPYDVVVVGEPDRVPAPDKDRSVAGSSISGERLHGAGLEAADVLRTQPGVQVTQSAGFGAPSTASIRGATAADTPIYLGGVRLNDDVGGTADLSLVPMWMIDRIEIYRGHAPIEADRFGPGGAIFFEPKRPRGTVLGAGATAGSFGSLRGFAYGGLAAGPASALLGASAETAGNQYPFLDDRGTLFDAGDDEVRRRTNADVHAADGWALARLDLGRGATVDALANVAWREQGVPRLALIPSRQARSEAARLLASVAVRVPLDDEDKAVVESRTSLLGTRSAYRDPLLELALYTPTVDLSARRIEESLSAKLALARGLSVRPALTLAYERLERTPADAPLDDTRRLFARLAGTIESRILDGLTVHALASGECHATGRAGSAQLVPSGRVGLEAGSERLRVLAHVGRYVRVPTLGELYGIAGPVRGNAELEPESGLTAELGLRTQTPRGTKLDWLYADAFVFARAASNLIAYKRTGQGYVLPYNIGRARVLGAELALGASLLSLFRLELAATFLDPRDTSPERTTTNDLIAYRPRAVLAPRIAFAKRVGSVLSSLGADATYTYTSSRYADPAGLAVIGASGTLDAGLDSTWLEGLLSAKLRATNLLDTRRTDVVGYPLPGRAYFLAMEISWEVE